MAVDEWKKVWKKVNEEKRKVFDALLSCEDGAARRHRGESERGDGDCANESNIIYLWRRASSLLRKSTPENFCRGAEARKGATKKTTPT